MYLNLYENKNKLKFIFTQYILNAYCEGFETDR